ncbi:hypothetical protein OEZ86_005964 [Tetradesmus obliquus]|nr:hypothetical protein OEZ86_005964 [Tetradesmus obliquus]
MSAHALKEFLKQVKVDIPRGLTQREQLLELAKAAVQLWEAHRVLRCARIGQQHPSLELPAALAVFKQKSHAAGAAVTAAAEEAEKRALKKACRQLQLALHPDKTPQQLAGQQAVFVEAFKALQHAQQLVPALKTAKVVMYNCFRPGDIVRAKVMGDARSYHLSTADNSLGVVRAKSLAGVAMVPVSWQEMQCPQTKAVERRKVAKVEEA